MKKIFDLNLGLLIGIPLDCWQFFIRIGLLVTLSLSLAELFWLVLPVPSIPPAKIETSPVAGYINATRKVVSNVQLKGLLVFGKGDAHSVKQEATIIDSQAVDTNLSLILVGIIFGNEEQLSRAVIESEKRQGVYAIGATLAVGKNVTLSKIMSDRVIINNNGRYESLWLYLDNPNVRPNSQAFHAFEQLPSDSGAQTSSSGADSQGDKDDHVSASSEASRAILDVVSMSIYGEGEQVLGYKINSGRDPEKLKSLGLQVDDIILGVNGIPFPNTEKMMEIYKNMGNTTSASLEIKRAGSVITVDVVLQ